MAMHHLAGVVALTLLCVVSCRSTATDPAPAEIATPEKPVCAEGEVARSACVECGPTDNCTRSEMQCLPTCETVSDCEGREKHYDTCAAGVCMSFLCG